MVNWVPSFGIHYYIMYTGTRSGSYATQLGRVAQLVEHHTVYVKVVGSSPIFFVYLVMLCETVYSLRTLNLLRKFRGAAEPKVLNLPGKLRRTAESKISFGAARR